PGHHRAAVAGDGDPIVRAARLPQRDAAVDAAGRRRQADRAGAVDVDDVGVRLRGVEDHLAAGLQVPLAGEGEAAAVHVVDPGLQVQRGLAAALDAAAVHAGVVVHGRLAREVHAAE